MGRPLADLSRQEKDYVFIAVRAAARAADTATVRAKFDLLGIVGSVALERLRGVGFACHFQIKQGSKANGVVLVPADLPFYQCSKVEVVSSCTCERIQITFGLPPQEPGGSAEAYAAQLDLMVLGQHDVSYACGDG